MNRLRYSIAVGVCALLFASVAFAAIQPYQSAQVGTSPVAGSVLQTNGISSTWAPTSSLGFISTSTGLTTANFATTSISQWINDPGFLRNASITAISPIAWSSTSTITCPTCQTTSTGLTTANFASANISQWTNNSGYVTSTPANPTATVGTSATNGTANTFMRSDAAPAINQAATFSFSALGNTTSTGNVGGATINASASIINQGVKNALVIGTSTGLQVAYAGSSCTAGSMVASISATGTVSCQATSTVLSGYSTSTPANPTATIGTTAVNGTANTFMRSDGAPALGAQFASGTIMFPFYDATTTAPYRELKMRIPFAATVGTLFCDEYAAATSTMSLYRVDTNGSTSTAATIFEGLACGKNGTSTATFTSSTIPIGTWLRAVVSSTAGTPTLTQLNVELKKN